MLTKGYCLPIELESVSVCCTLDVSDESVSSVVFFSPTELLVVDKVGRLFLCDISTSECRSLIDLGPPDSYGYSLVAHNQDEFLVIEPFYNPDTSNDDINIYCLNRDGIAYWSLEYPDIGWQLIFDGRNYLAVGANEQNEHQLYYISNEGRFQLLRDFQRSRASLYWAISTGEELFMLGPLKGPWVSHRSDSYSTFEQWHSGWDDGLIKPSYDSQGRLLGFKSDYYDQRTEDSSLVILDPNNPMPQVIPFDRELGLERYGVLDPWGSNYHAASNGEDIAFTFTHHLIKYFDGNLEIWLDNLDDYTDATGGSTTIGAEGITTESHDMLYIDSLYIDSPCTHFIMTLRRTILFGNNDIEVIELGGGRTTGLVFSENFERAAIGIEGGNIVVLDITASQS